MIDLPSLDSPENLRQAFEVFNHLSQTLTDSYRDLENQVARLNRELAAARSERLKTLTEKEKLANRLQRLLEALPGGVIVLDGEGRIVECNPAAIQLLGEPLLGERWGDIMTRSFIPAHDNPHERSLKNGRTVSIAARSLGNEPGQILLLADVSEMRALQELVDQHKRLSAMGEMVASLAHQVRTPLAVAVLYASQLGSRHLDADRRRHFVSRILERLHHLERQVNDMLIFAREGRFVMERIRLGDFLRRLRESAEPHFLSGEVGVVFAEECGDEAFQGNPEALLGAFLNLITNALEAMEGQGRLEVQAGREGNFIRISVLDDGPGMAAEVRGRIFEPFYTTRPNGTGLGLAVVEGIVRAHGGFVRCESEPGEGAAFHVHLPLLEVDLPLSGGYRAGVDALAGIAMVGGKPSHLPPRWGGSMERDAEWEECAQ